MIDRHPCTVNLAFRTGVSHRQTSGCRSNRWLLRGYAKARAVPSQDFVQLLRPDRLAQVPVHSRCKTLFVVALLLWSRAIQARPSGETSRYSLPCTGGEEIGRAHV